MRCAGSSSADCCPRWDRNRGRVGRRLSARPRACRHRRGNDLFPLRPAQRARGQHRAVDWSSAVLLGFASVLAAAWFPALSRTAESVDTLPRRADRAIPVRLSRGWILAGGSSLLLSLLLSVLTLRTGPPWLGFGAAFFVLAGFSSIAPVITASFSRAATGAIHQHIEVRLAAQNLSRALLRNAVTIASLATAVAMTVGIAVMVFSFRQTVGDWIKPGVDR